MAITLPNEGEKPNWLSRMGSSLKGVLTGLAVVAGAVVLLFWNEGRAVKNANQLKEGAEKVVGVPSDKLDAQNDGKLVHVNGLADTKDTLSDPVFGISEVALKLERKVEIFQWVEHSKTVSEKQGDKTVSKPVYSYEKEWCAKPVDSQTFHEKRAGVVNPPVVMPFSNEEKVAQNVTLGAFKLSSANVQRIHGYTPFQFAPEFKLPEALKGASLVNGAIYLPASLTPAAPAATATPASDSSSPLMKAAMQGNVAQAVSNAVNSAFSASASNPQIGDLRVTFRVVKPHDVSICAMQKEGTFVPWAASEGKPIMLQEDGLHEAATMFAGELESNARWTWVLRVIGFFVMFGGFKMVFGPFSTLVDVIPIIRNIVSVGVGVVSFLMALAVSLITVGISWIFHRPLLGVLLLVVAGGCLAMVLMKRGKAAQVK